VDVRSDVPGAASIELAYAAVGSAGLEDVSVADAATAATRTAPETTMASGRDLGSAITPL
jgi:hypothetical protein